MNKTALVLLSVLSFAGSSMAGPLVALPVVENQVTPSPLFRDQELFFDLYGSYLQHHDAGACDCGGKTSGYGGGFAIGHYFAYYVGARMDVNFTNVNDVKSVIGGDVLLRFPIPETHAAPYIFAGGGVESDHGFFRLGGGLEWRFTRHFGIFGECSYAWISQDPSANDLAVKVGVRVVY